MTTLKGPLIRDPSWLQRKRSQEPLTTSPGVDNTGCLTNTSQKQDQGCVLQLFAVLFLEGLCLCLPVLVSKSLIKGKFFGYRLPTSLRLPTQNHQLLCDSFSLTMKHKNTPLFLYIFCHSVTVVVFDHISHSQISAEMKNDVFKCLEHEECEKQLDIGYGFCC